MSILDSLKSSLRHWENKASEYRNLRSVLNGRKGELERIKADLRSASRSNSDEVNFRLNGAVNHLTNGISLSGMESLLSDLSAKKEKGYEDDADLYAADVELSEAIRAVSAQIEEASGNIKHADGEVDYYRSEIRGEERRLEEERRQREAQERAERAERERAQRSERERRPSR